MIAIGLALLAVVGFGSGAIFARLGMQYATPLPVTLVSLVFSFLLSAALALVFALPDLGAMPPVILAWCLLLGTLNFLGGRNLNYLAVGRIGAARTSAIVSTSTIFAAVLAITLTGERPHYLVALGTAVVITGLITALGRSIFEGSSLGRATVFGILLAFASAACYGSTNVVVKQLTQEYTSPLVVSTISLFFGTLLVLPVAARPTALQFRRGGSLRRFVGLAGLSGLASAMAVNTLYFALQMSEVVIISPITSANPLVTLLLASVFLSQLENVNRWLFLGVVVTVTGVVLVVVGSQL